MQALVRTAAIIIAALSLSFSALAQVATGASVYITVKNAKGESRKGLEVALADKKLVMATPIRSFTDATGKAAFTLTRGTNYTIRIDGAVAGDLAVPTTGMGVVTKTITYEFKPATAAIDTIRFNVGDEIKPTESEGVAIVNVFSHSETPVEGVKITLVNTQINKAFVAYSNVEGAARMRLPIGKDYAMYTDDIEFGYEFKMPDIPYINKGFRIQYIPTKVRETASGDTIRQNQDDITEATADRAFIYFNITNPQGERLQNEPVYLNSTKTGKIYTAITQDAGRAKFLIPEGEILSVNFKYERDIDLIDLTQRKGYRTIEVDYTYLGSAKIESFYKDAKRDMNGFRTEFLEMEVKQHKIHDNYLEKTTTGYNLKLTEETAASSVSSSPPAVSGNNLMISGGYYSHYFYGFDKTTGQNKWGVELADGGASAAVSDSGVTLIITQSCTLYALEENTGKPLWTKWLGSSMYSTPTVANGKVYAVYPDDLIAYGGEDKGNYVLVCFGLKKGDVLWQKRLDGNVLGSPVVANGNVYLSSTGGTVYAFAGITGKDIAHKKVDAIAPPTIMGNNLIVTTAKDEKTKLVKMYNATSLELVKQLPGTLSPHTGFDNGAIAEMNNDNGRALAYKGKLYYTLSGILYCADATGKLVWSKPFTGGESAMPVVAGGKIVVATEQGQVHLFGAIDGALVKKYDTGNPIFSQPVIEDGVIYTSTKTGKMNAIKTGDKTLDGWAMWNGNSSHNTLVE